MTAREKLLKKLNTGLHICVGLDTDFNKIPNFLKNEKDPIFEFNKIIIESTKEDAAAYKINFAFYEKLGARGLDIIKKTLELIPNNILTIADAKRGDIGNTSEMYAKAIFDEFNFDSITLHPYMGFDSLKPFFDYDKKLNFILALTSNAGSNDFEKLKLENGKYLYQQVIERINEWNQFKNLGIVFGATNLDELKSNLNSFGDLFILLPGVGAQGGSLEEVVKAFLSIHSNNFLINVSRALIYCDASEKFGEKVNLLIKNYNESISEILK